MKKLVFFIFFIIPMLSKSEPNSKLIVPTLKILDAQIGCDCPDNSSVGMKLRIRVDDISYNVFNSSIIFEVRDQNNNAFLVNPNIAPFNSLTSISNSGLAYVYCISTLPNMFLPSTNYLVTATANNGSVVGNSVNFTSPDFMTLPQDCYPSCCNSKFKQLQHGTGILINNIQFPANSHQFHLLINSVQLQLGQPIVQIRAVLDYYFFKPGINCKLLDPTTSDFGSFFAFNHMIYPNQTYNIVHDNGGLLPLEQGQNNYLNGIDPNIVYNNPREVIHRNPNGINLNYFLFGITLPKLTNNTGICNFDLTYCIRLTVTTADCNECDLVIWKTINSNVLSSSKIISTKNAKFYETIKKGIKELKIN